MERNLIAELLKPFLAPISHNTDKLFCNHPRQTVSPDHEVPITLSIEQLTSISTYIDLLIRWNARINLTAIRDPEQIVTRHFGESLFAARHLFPSASVTEGSTVPDLLDIGSGPGFPALPIKIWAPQIRLTLVESNQKKTTFLREVSRALTLTNVNVLNSRAEDLPAAAAGTVTFRAVERFHSVLPVAIRLVRPGGRLALLIGDSQLESAQTAAAINWNRPIPIPQSASRILLIGNVPYPASKE